MNGSILKPLRRTLRQWIIPFDFAINLFLLGDCLELLFHRFLLIVVFGGLGLLLDKWRQIANQSDFFDEPIGNFILRSFGLGRFGLLEFGMGLVLLFEGVKGVSICSFIEIDDEGCKLSLSHLS
jgi:hypothetical protein